jgi:hypothetical protein
LEYSDLERSESYPNQLKRLFKEIELLQLKHPIDPTIDTNNKGDDSNIIVDITQRNISTPQSSSDVVARATTSSSSAVKKK